ncbi:MAG: CopG family transcriptional regulator [bacterium]
MAQMIRKQVYIEQRQDAILKRLAHVRGATEAEIIRKAIQREANAVVEGEGSPDPQAWGAVRDFILTLIAKGSAAGGRKWKRQDIYEERLKRDGR